MPRRMSLESVTLTALRRAHGSTSQELAKAVGVSVKTIHRYEGEQAPARERLEEIVAAMGYGPEAIDFVLLGLRLSAGAPPGPSSPVDPSPEELRLLRRAGARAGLSVVDLIEQRGLRLVRGGRARHARKEAARLWGKLKRLTPDERRRLVEVPGCATWALAERLCHESEEAASDRADVALELAELALRVAELAPGDEVWRSRVLGYAKAFLANALRVRGDLKEAEDVFGQAWRLWQAGAPADPGGVLAEWRLLDREASLRRAQRRFADALGLFPRALALAPRTATGRILLNKAFTFDQMGEPERAVEILREAAPLVDGRRDPRLLFGLRFNLAGSLVKLGRPAEAEALIPEVRERAVALRKELDLLRVVWLQAQVAAGLGRTEEAVAAYGQVQRELLAHEMAYDYALASLELAVLHLEADRRGEVKELARQMLWIFRDRDVHREAHAALRIFCEAAEREEATVELARRIGEYLARARRDPDLRFVP